jgi:hypothetical protein
MARQIPPLRSFGAPVLMNKRLWWASPIVFGPRTLKRTWGTRAELWDPPQLVIRHLTCYPQVAGSR